MANLHFSHCRNWQSSTVISRILVKLKLCSFVATGAEEGSEEAESGFGVLPLEVVGRVLELLDPLSLAKAACVCSEWKVAAGCDTLWKPLCLKTFPSFQLGFPEGSCQMHFARAAAGELFLRSLEPRSLNPWSRNSGV